MDAFANLRLTIFESTFILDVSYDAWTPLNATPGGEAGRAGWSARIGDWGICMVLEVKCQYGVERVKRQESKTICSNTSSLRLMPGGQSQHEGVYIIIFEVHV